MQLFTELKASRSRVSLNSLRVYKLNANCSAENDRSDQ
jgi:hypothetical protein